MILKYNPTTRELDLISDDASEIGGLTVGSIPFADPDGFLTEDNANLLWDNTNLTLQLGDAATEPTITISGTAYKSHLKVNEFDDGHLATVQLHRHSETDALGAAIVASRSNSSGTGHGVVTDGQCLMGIYAAGWSDVDYDIAAQIHMAADGNFAANDAPGKISFWTTPSGSNVSLQRMTLKNSGLLGINQPTPTAMLHIVPNSTTEEGLFIKAPASYTGEFIECQDSSGVNRFDVKLTGAGANTQLTVHSNSGAAIMLLDGLQTSDAQVGGLTVHNGSDSIAAFTCFREGANDAGNLRFYTQPTGGTNTERMRITSTGFLGSSG
jgi:hypothetical protein